MPHWYIFKARKISRTKGVIEIRDLSDTLITTYNWQKGTFGMKHLYDLRSMETTFNNNNTLTHVRFQFAGKTK